MTFYQERASLLKLMAHPVRLQILDLLRQDGECVCHLSAALRKTQPYVSQQLAVLRNAGLITDRKDGTNVFYGLASEQVMRQVDAMLGPPRGKAAESRGHARVRGCSCPKCAPARSQTRKAEEEAVPARPSSSIVRPAWSAAED